MSAVAVLPVIVPPCRARRLSTAWQKRQRYKVRTAAPVPYHVRASLKTLKHLLGAALAMTMTTLPKCPGEGREPD